jgi:hypothetical protein
MEEIAGLLSWPAGTKSTCRSGKQTTKEALLKSFPLFAALIVAGSASAAQVWVAPAAQKIRPGVQAPAGASATAKIAAAKNEFESFHVVITGAASGVSMSLEGLNDGKGHTIAGRDVVLYREALLNVTVKSGGDGAAGMWPDALVPDVDPIAGEKRNAFPFDVPAGESRAVLVDIHAPKATPAGIYKGTINITGGVNATVPVELTVWDFEVPSTSTLKSAFGMTWNGPCAGHGDPGCTNYAGQMALRARYVQAALDNHVSIYAPWYTATVAADGSQNWGDFDKYVGPALDGTGQGRLQGAKLTAVQVNGPSTTNVVGGWASHFKAKGWFPALFTYVCDEPPLTCAWSEINNRINASKAADASVPTLVTTTTAQAKQMGVNGIDLYVPVVNYMEGKPGSEHAGSQRAKYGNNVWWYQSCMSFGCSGVGGGLDGSGETGWPSYAVDTDGTRNRAMEWMSFTYDMQGELYYETTQVFGSSDPWSNQFAFGGTGDGTLFYPGTPAKIGGTTDIPVESLRLKGIRDGMEDYELLNLAAKLGQGDKARQIALGVFPKTYQSTSSPAAIDAARAELAGLILHAMGKDTSAATCTTTGCNGTIDSPARSTELSQAGGCSSTGLQSAWLMIPALAMFVLRRKNARKAK